jgi:hypothetical protein
MNCSRMRSHRLSASAQVRNGEEAQAQRHTKSQQTDRPMPACDCPVSDSPVCPVWCVPSSVLPRSAAAAALLWVSSSLLLDCSALLCWSCACLPHRHTPCKPSMRRHVLLAAILLLACATLCVSALDARQLRGVRPKGQPPLCHRALCPSFCLCCLPSRPFP